MPHQPAISFSTSVQKQFSRAGGCTSNVSHRIMSSTQHTIDTPLGGLQVRAIGVGNAAIVVIKPDIQLPIGMSVSSTVAVLIHISAMESLANVRCECVWDDSPAAGNPESGECLDAQSWDSDGYRVTIGTEDFEALNRRLPLLGLMEAENTVIYSDSGLTIVIPTVPKDTEFSIHFVIAWRSLPDPAEISTWIAVGIPHSKLVESNTNSHPTAGNVLL